MKTIIAGSRNITDYNLLKLVVEESGIEMTAIISGGAKGIDSLGEWYGQCFGIPVYVMPAEWDKYGKAAGFIRNEQMAKEADALIAVWDGKSKGTMHMIKYAKEKGLEVFVWDLSTK